MGLECYTFERATRVRNRELQARLALVEAIERAQESGDADARREALYIKDVTSRLRYKVLLVQEKMVQEIEARTRELIAMLPAETVDEDAED
jgi:hypothetical protein